MGQIKTPAADDSLPKVRKIGKKSKTVKSVICSTCGAGCSTKHALIQHNSRHHGGTVAKRQAQAKKHREATKVSDKKTQLGTFCNVEEKDKLDVFIGDINQDDPIDDDENEFMRLVKLARGKVRPYYGNVILVVPAKVKVTDLEEFCNNKLNKYNAYIGTCSEKGACIIHQMLNTFGSCSSPAKMLMEKDKKGNSKWTAYHYELTFDKGVSTEKNQKDAFKWESFHTYAAAGQRKTKSGSIQVKYLNERIEILEGLKGELTDDQIQRAYRLGRSNYPIIGSKQEFQGVQIRFPVRDAKGKHLFEKFSSELVEKPENSPK